MNQNQEGGGKRNVAFPAPELVFGSFLAKWNAFSDKCIKGSLMDVVATSMLVSGYKLETRMLDFGRYKDIGFRGSSDYEISDSAGDPEGTRGNMHYLSGGFFPIDVPAGVMVWWSGKVEPE